MAGARSAGDAQLSDGELIQRIREGDHGAFDLLYERYFHRVYNYVDRRLRNRADTEETVQEVFISVFSCLDSFRGDAPFGAWILGIARRTVAGRFKKRRHATVPLLDAEEGDAENPLSPSVRREPTPLENYECAERIAQLRAAAKRHLSEDQRRLFELHHLRHHSIREIARHLETSENAVKSHLYRARKLLLAR